MWQARYRSLGRALSLTGGPGLDLRLPSQYRDAETGYRQNGHWDYDPSTGRSLEPDQTLVTTQPQTAEPLRCP